MKGFRELKRREIDDDLWNTNVSKYGDGRPYSYTWYLDALTQGKWRGLIAEDYSLILPLPYHQKYIYQRRVYQPFLSQFFGPIGSNEAQKLCPVFVKYFEDNYRNSHLYFTVNSIEDSSSLTVSKRVNQVIKLGREIESIRSDYTKERRSKIRNYSPMLEVSFTTDIKRFLIEYKAVEYPKTKPLLKQWNLLTRLLHTCDQQGILEIIRVSNQEGRVLTTAAFLATQSRVINLIGASAAKGREFHANAVKIDQILGRYSKDKKVFDFFGSNIPGVNTFNRQFGAVEEAYVMIET